MNQTDELLSRAKSAFATRHYEMALSLCEQILQLKQSHGIDALLLAGSICIAMDKPKKAEVFFEKAIELVPQNGEIHFMLGNALFGQQRLSEALQSYAKAEKYGCSDESRKKLYYLMGLINQVQGQPKAALANYKKSLKLIGPNVDQVDIFLKCTQLCVEAQRFDEAEDYARQIKLLKPEEFRSYELLFQILLQEKKIENAFDVLSDAEDTCSDGNIADISLYRSLLYSVLSEIEVEKAAEYRNKAFEQLDTIDITKISPTKQLEVALSKAEIFLKTEDIANARKLTEDALTVEYSGDLADYFDKAKFILLECLKEEKQLAEAKPHAVALTKSKNAFYRCHGLYSVAWITRETEGFEVAKRLYAEAIAFYRSSTAQNPANMIAYSYRIRAYADTGEKGKAKELCAILPDGMRAEMESYINDIHS